jgi:hypothetical protein
MDSLIDYYEILCELETAGARALESRASEAEDLYHTGLERWMKTGKVTTELKDAALLGNESAFLLHSFCLSSEGSLVLPRELGLMNSNSPIAFHWKGVVALQQGHHGRAMALFSEAAKARWPPACLALVYRL